MILEVRFWPVATLAFIPLPDHFRRAHLERLTDDIRHRSAKGKADALRRPEPLGILAPSPARPSMGHLDPAQAAAAKPPQKSN